MLSEKESEFEEMRVCYNCNYYMYMIKIVLTMFFFIYIFHTCSTFYFLAKRCIKVLLHYTVQHKRMSNGQKLFLFGGKYFCSFTNYKENGQKPEAYSKYTVYVPN